MISLHFTCTSKIFTSFISFAGEPIPKRMIPPEDAIAYYTDPKNRGYLADPDQVNKQKKIS